MLLPRAFGITPIELMSAASDNPFLQFLAAGLERGGFETDDALAAVVPLMKQVLAAHEDGMVAPLEGLTHLTIGEGRHLTFDSSRPAIPRRDPSRVEQLQAAASQAVEVVGRSSRTADIDAGSLQLTNLEVASAKATITRPVYLPDYKSWEHAVGHHDELTDIFSLGLLLASVACGLDFTDPTDLEAFAGHRENLFTLNSRLNPVVAAVIAQMTALNRHRRAQDLGSLIRRLENYRDQTTDFDTAFTSLKGFKDSPLAGKRTLIQSHLRDRLFEISRRNRLIYFKPTLQTLNLTVASVPLLLDYRNIRLEQLFVWHPELAATVADGAPMSLGKYLRFEDAPYIPGVLDKIISEPRRDRAEYGFAQLRLVLCFLRWNNLKEDKHERIHSPLLLLPVELTKKKGVRDNYVLDPTTSEAEVNPALRHHLKELYNLTLPEFIDLKETSLDQFYDSLKAQIHASEPGVTLNKLDRPQIEIIHEKARQRVDQYRRRLKLQARKARVASKPDYSYDRENLRPLGLQLFLEKVRPTPMPLRDVAGAPPQPRLPHMVAADVRRRTSTDAAANPPPHVDGYRLHHIVEPAAPAETGKVLETERQMFALRDGDNQNPYSWDFDLCSLTLGNFNYRKMTLVRDYANLIDTDIASASFDTIFSLSPKAPEETPPADIALPDKNLIIQCDATQASAIALARKGKSYIIQGPPGTGKSQTITNLIADYTARDKRVLFVCEKRAAIDVVYHRLKQVGLDRLCALIHDSQADKKAFIQDLKATYERYLAQPDALEDVARQRTDAVTRMQAGLDVIARFSAAMTHREARDAAPVRRLFARLVELAPHVRPLSEVEAERMPGYGSWLTHAASFRSVCQTLQDLGVEPILARHPVSWLSRGVFQEQRPIEALTRSIHGAEQALDALVRSL